LRTCSRCGRGIKDEFRFCPRCGTPLRSKVIEYFQGESDFGDGALRVSVYLTSPQHVRLSIWKGEGALAALSLSPQEADRLVQFLQNLRVTQIRRLETALRRKAVALADSISDAVTPVR
jgi:hypothetical protein